MICLLALPVAISGCAMCCGPDDFSYPMFDNCNYPRLNPEYGRVGSVFSDPNVPIGLAPLTNADVPRDDDSLDPLNTAPLDDPEFNRPIDPNDPKLDPEVDPFQPGAGDEDIDTAAERPRRLPVRRPQWR